MKKIIRIIQQNKKLIETIKDRIDLNYIISFTGDPKIFYDRAEEFWQKKIAITCEIDNHLNDGLNEMYKACTCVYDANEVRWMPVIKCFINLGYYVCILSNKKLFISNIANSQYSPEEISAHINQFYKKEFNNSIELEQATDDEYNELISRVNSVYDYYISQHGEWTQNFIDNLGDDISKFSFRDFLIQRVIGHIRWNCKAIYPIIPPKETSEWREFRKNNPPKFPILDNCPKVLQDFFYETSFVFEQYGIEGAVEAQPGDIVIDAGAYVGDTAFYFYDKVGETGKIFAFEAIPQVVEYAKDNIRKNGYTNIEVVPFALTDSKKELDFAFYEAAPSGGSFESNLGIENNIKVQGIDLDSFVKERNIKVDYIKSDVEGGELELLQGAKETIKRDKPICGIALYHKQEDYHIIPKLLKELCPDYTFYFRCEAEPVLLAKVKNGR